MAEAIQILKVKALDTQLREQGYVVIPFLNKDEVAKLEQVFYENHPADVDHFYATAHAEDTDFRLKMDYEIRAVYERALKETFTNCRALGGSYIVKPKTSTEALQPHQDWNIVDEDHYRSFNVWVPLVDLTPDNGVIHVLPRSHDWMKTYRHISIPCVYGKVYQEVWDNMTPLYMKAGEALIYDHALVHASEANRTDKLRLACAYGIIPEGAEMILYWNNNGHVEKYRSNQEFFMEENIFTGPVGLTKLEDVDYNFHQVTAEELYQLMGIEPPQKEELVVEVSQEERSFWETYTPKNILREIKYRLTGS